VRASGKRVRVALAARGGTLVKVLVRVRTRAGKTIAGGRPVSVGRKRKVVTVRLRDRLRPGIYRVDATGTDRRGDGGAGAGRTFRVR
jgi:hypothetical protein